MKRMGNVYQEMCSLENFRAAELKARKGKEKQYGVKVFDRKKEQNLLALQ